MFFGAAGFQNTNKAASCCIGVIISGIVLLLQSSKFMLLPQKGYIHIDAKLKEDACNDK